MAGNFHKRDSAERIPTLPAVMGRLLSVYASDDYNIGDVVDVIEHDASISARVLRLANSVFFGLSGEVNTVGGAAMLLGSTTIQGLALGTSLLKPWEVNLAPKAVRDIWAHSYLAAVGMKELSGDGPQVGADRAGKLFTAGLLHDVGKILLLKRNPPAYAEILETSAGDAELSEAEKAMFGEDHREAGFEALHRWNLPPLVSGLASARAATDMRPEFRIEAETFVTVHAILTGASTREGGEIFGAEAVNRVRDRINRSAGDAEAFFRSIAGSG